MTEFARSTGESALGVNDGVDITQAAQDAKDSLLNPNGYSLNNTMNWPTPDVGHSIQDTVRKNLERVLVFLPVYNQQETIGTTLDYVLDQHQIPPERVIAVNCSDNGDKSGEILAQRGVKALDQWKVLNDAVNIDRLKGLLHINDIREVRGKGLTMFAGYLDKHLKGDSAYPDHTHIIQTDTDIGNIGTGLNKWDPLSYFSYYALQQDPSIEYFKAAKVGRNNEPFVVFNNSLDAFGAHGREYKRDLCKDIWPLTGEYGFRKGFAEQDIVYPSGYPIEMFINMRRAEMQLRWKQVSMPEPRLDGQNDWNKETPMYADIQRMMIMVLSRVRQLADLTEEDIYDINSKISFIRETAYIHNTKEVQAPVPKPLRASRLLGSIPQLQKLGIVYSGK